jgi:hypothetical protein
MMKAETKRGILHENAAPRNPKIYAKLPVTVPLGVIQVVRTSRFKLTPSRFWLNS